jgi:autotransporter-associated beta strand protein
MPGKNRLEGQIVKYSTRFLVGSLWVLCWSVAITLIFLFIGSSALYAQTDTWQGPQGASSWFIGGNWTLEAPPAPTQNATVDNGGTARIPTPPRGASTATAAILTIGSTVAGSTVQLFGGDLNAKSVIVGSHGTFEFSGGFLNTSVSFVDNGIVLFDTIAAQHISGLSGSGQLIINGIALTADGENAFNGETTINGGSLQIGTGGTIGSIAGNIIDNGILIFDRSDALTFAGAISGTGNVTQNGTGTTILTGNNIYSGGTTINAGTLQLGNGGTTGSITGNVVDNGVLAFDRSDSFTFAGVISGAGNVSQIGTGTTILTGSNTYTGGTTISAGTLQLGNGGTAGSITGDIINNGILAFDRSDVSTVGGGIAGAGDVTQIGTGTTILAGNNTYTGATIITAGTLKAGSANGFSPNSEFTVNSILDLNSFSNTIGSLSGTGIVLNNGATGVALTVGNDNANSTFSGVLENGTGALQLIKSGAGTLTLTGNNTYTGGTTISAGTLQIGNGGTTGSITGNVTDNGVLAFNRSDSVTFSGVIGGTGSLVKLGTGALTLPGANTYTGTTTVNNGSLIVDGSIASQQTIVNANGFLGGHGTIGGNLVNNGIVSQLNSPGTLTVLGNYTQNPGGTLRIAIGGTASNQHDTLVVNGHLTLGGTLQLVRLGGFTLQPGDQITFLTAGKGVSGDFGTVQNGFAGTIVQGTITSLANAIVLEGTQGSFAQTPGVVKTPNGLAVAKALDSIAGDPRAAELIAFLNSEPLANLPHDLALIAPTQISSISATGVSLGKVQISNLGQRMANIRGGSSGFSSSGFAINGGAASSSEGFAGVTGPEGKSGPPVFAPTPDNRWGVFLTGLGEFTNVDSTPNAGGYGIDTGGFTLGVDYRVSPNFAIGLTGGYAHTNVNLDGGGNIDVNGGKIGLYATLFGNGFYLDTAVSGGPSGYDTNRTALRGSASGSTDGTDLNVLVAAGYDWKHGDLTIGPTASFQYSYIGLDGFTESGSLAPLKFPDQNSGSERTAFGAKASYDWKIGHVTVIPQISAAWQHEFGSTEYSVVANFANGAGNSFTVRGPQTGRDSLLVGAGATVILNDRVSTYIFYDGEVARTNYESHNVSGGVRISF